MAAKILIVDDEDNVVRMLGYALTAAGYQVISAGTGGEALAKAVAERPELVVLDVNLSDMTGKAVCQQLRGRPETEMLPIIMLSARVEVSDKISGLEAGADEYVTKPFDCDEMVARVTALLDRTRRLGHAVKREPAKVVAFTGAKGGVGTTTVALNVAAALVAIDKRVIAAELRSTFGTCALQLGQTPAENLSSLLCAEQPGMDVNELQRRLVKCRGGLKVLFGPQEGDDYKEIKPEQAETMIRGLVGLADYVIVDLPGDLSAATRATMRQSDLLVVVADCDPAGLAAGRATLRLLKSSGACSGQVGAVAVNRTVASRSVNVEEIGRQMGCTLLGVVPPAEEACMAAMRLGAPIVLSQSDSLAACALRKIGQKVADLCT